MKAVILAIGLALSTQTFAQTGISENWNGIVEEAKGQIVYFNAWGGESRTNNYIRWAAEQVEDLYGIKLVHVKLSDTSEAVSRVIAEQQAGNTTKGAVDLIWINGENFATLKRAGLLHGPWVGKLPNFPLTDPENNPEMTTDFTVPVEGYEAPWSKAQVVFYYDKSLTENPPTSMPELLKWAKTNPGEFSYPKPPQFLGTTFLKQALLELSDNRDALYKPVEEANFEEVTAPLWSFLDALHPYLWRSGRTFPDNGPALRRMMADGVLSLAFSFNPNEAASAIANSELPPTVRTYVLNGGTIGNVSFLAIPFNASHKAGAMVVANFLMSPEAQAHKQNPENWGSITVLAMDKLSSEDRARFDALPIPVGGVATQGLQQVVGELHPSWIEALERAWQERYMAH
ncbi:MAG: ABC transporter substrate-binding protein [Pseudomonadota bacterium]|nr:ABC transporter substrate-binding protein [Pseudomonadota bacterium]